MKPMQLTIGAAVLATLGIGLALGTPALAQKGAKSDAKTPDGWSYDIKDGRRVPKAKRVTAADGSWREEIRDGDCVTIREKTKTGEYRETRHC